MPKTSPTPTAAASSGPVPYVRVATADIDTKVRCAGADWAGVSEVPAKEFTAAQLDELMKDGRLTVELFEREAPPAEATA